MFYDLLKDSSSMPLKFDGHYYRVSIFIENSLKLNKFAKYWNKDRTVSGTMRQFCYRIT